MAYSSDPAAQRGFVPPQNDQERLVMRRVQDLCGIAMRKGIARYSSFLSDREQTLAQAALNREGCEEYSFDGGYPFAERKILCIEPVGPCGTPPIACVQVECFHAQDVPAHKDYLGAVLGLGLDRSSIGDIVPDPQAPGTAYVFALEPAAELLCNELASVGRYSVHTQRFYGEIPVQEPERTRQSATVSSLRADAVLAAMLRCSRGQAADLVRGGRLEINHVAVSNPHAPVYQGDLFTVRGNGRFRLEEIGGKSKKDRQFITFFQY